MTSGEGPKMDIWLHPFIAITCANHHPILFSLGDDPLPVSRGKGRERSFLSSIPGPLEIGPTPGPSKANTT